MRLCDNTIETSKQNKPEATNTYNIGKGWERAKEVVLMNQTD